LSGGEKQEMNSLSYLREGVAGAPSQADVGHVSAEGSTVLLWVYLQPRLLLHLRGHQEEYGGKHLNHQPRVVQNQEDKSKKHADAKKKVMRKCAKGVHTVATRLAASSRDLKDSANWPSRPFSFDVCEA
jgi:hypothetical protein